MNQLREVCIQGMLAYSRILFDGTLFPRFKIEKDMKVHININLCATLTEFIPENAGNYPIDQGASVGSLLEQLGVPQDKVKFIFIDGKKSNIISALHGGERVSIFPIVCGG